MKKILVGLAALALLGAGCQKEQVIQTQPEPTPANTTEVSSGFTASLEEFAAEYEALPRFTMDQIIASKAEGKCLVVIYNKVVDLTDFVKKHPGGEKALQDLCGTDATDEFTSKHGAQDNPAKVEEANRIGILQQ